MRGEYMNNFDLRTVSKIGMEKQTYECSDMVKIPEVGDVTIFEKGETNFCQKPADSTKFVREYKVKASNGKDDLFIHRKNGNEETCTEINSQGIFELENHFCQHLRSLLPCEDEE